MEDMSEVKLSRAAMARLNPDNWGREGCHGKPEGLRQVLHELGWWPCVAGEEKEHMMDEEAQVGEGEGDDVQVSRVRQLQVVAGGDTPAKGAHHANATDMPR